MSSFSFGKNFLEEQFLVIDHLENRIINQEITLEELIKTLELLIRNTPNHENLRAILEKVSSLHMSKEAQNHIQQILLQHHQSNVMDKLVTSLDKTAPSSPLYLDMKEEVSQNEKPKAKGSSSIQVYDEWTDDTENYDTTGWYEGRSFAANIEPEDKSRNEIVQLEEDIQENETGNKTYYDGSNYEGIHIVVADPKIAESLKIPKFEVSDHLSEDSFPYEYVKSIVQKIESIPPKSGANKLNIDDIDLEEQEKQEDITDSKTNENHQTIASSELGVPEEAQELESEELSEEAQELESEELSEEAQELESEELSEEAQELESEELSEEAQELESEELSEEAQELESEELSEEAQELESEELSEEAQELESEIKTLDIRDEIDFLGDEDLEDTTLKDFDATINFNTPPILEKKMHEDDQERQEDALLIEDEDILDAQEERELIASTQEDDLAELETDFEPLETTEQTEEYEDITQRVEDDLLESDEVYPQEGEEEIAEPIMSDKQDRKDPKYWWIDYPVLEYPEEEDFGTFILYRDLG